MNNLTIRENQLPTTLEDLSSFILVGREKLVSVRAEIRAIGKLNLAQEVRNQKREEAQMLSEALLDAEVRLGELLKQIPKQAGGDRKSQDFKKGTTAPFDKPQCSTAPKLEKPKHEIVKDLGFSVDQQKRFETLADNKDLVEQVKAEARENDDIPTRSRVLGLAQQRKKREEETPKTEQPGSPDYYQYIDLCTKIAKNFNRVLHEVDMLPVDDKHLAAWKEFLDEQDIIQTYISQVDENIPKLIKIQRFLKGLIK